MKNFIPPPLYPIANLQKDIDNLPYIYKLINSGIKILQLRAKEHSVEQLSALTNKVLDFAQKNNPNLILLINDFVEVVLKTNAHGIHLGQDDISPEEVRKILGPDKIIGFSTHTIQQIKTAPIEFLDYLAIGPIFDSPTKSGHAQLVGLEQLELAVKISPLPLVAIGGITLNNAKEVFKRGAQSVALVSELEKSGDLKKTISDFEESHCFRYNKFSN